MRFELRSLRVAAGVYDLVVYLFVVTFTFQNIAACKLLFFVKNKGQWNAKSGPKVGDGKVAM